MIFKTPKDPEPSLVDNKREVWDFRIADAQWREDDRFSMRLALFGDCGKGRKSAVGGWGKLSDRQASVVPAEE
jgi:hypothetical protein